MKVYVVMQAIPWGDFRVRAPEGSEPGQMICISPNEFTSGFLPIVQSKEAAEAGFPGIPIQEAEVDDRWPTPDKS